MKSPRLRALVLAAGFGLRLRPLTLFLPKALLPICGRPLVTHTLQDLARIGCEGVALNLHHLPEAIPNFLGNRFGDLPLTYSLEDPIQGTLGALFPLREFLSKADLVLVVNGDTLCSWPWKTMIRKHLRSEADVTLLLHRRPPDQRLGGPVGIDARGAVVQLRDTEPIGEVAHRHIFAGAQILSPRFLSQIDQGPADIVGDLYIPLLRSSGRIQSVVTARRWHDLGTPQRYLDASLEWLRRSKFGLRQRNAVSSLADVEPSSVLSRSIIEAGAIIERDASIEGSVLMSNVRVSVGSTIRSSIIGPEVELPRAATIERRMVTRIRSGYHPNAGETVMGELVYSPLESG